MKKKTQLTLVGITKQVQVANKGKLMLLQQQQKNRGEKTWLESQHKLQGSSKLLFS